MRQNIHPFTRSMFFSSLAPALMTSVGLMFSDVADSLVLGQRIGEAGLAAISMALPVFMIFNLIMHGLGLGGSILYSRQMAEGRQEEARRSFSNIMTAGVAVGFILALLGNLFPDTLLLLLGVTADSPELYAVTGIYVRFIISGAPLFFLSYMLNYYLRNADCQNLAGVGFTIGNLSDLGLNIVMVLFLDMGAMGAALSTLIGLCMTISIYMVGLIVKKALPFRLTLPDFRQIGRCFRVGFSSSVQYLFQMGFVLIGNQVLIHSGDMVAVAVFSLIQNASYMFIYLYEAVSKAQQPLISTYQGERNFVQQRATMVLSLRWGAILGVITIAFVLIKPELLCYLFGLTTEEGLRLGCYALRIYCVSTIFAGMSVLLSSAAQAREEESEALLLYTLRGAAVLLPMTVLFSCFGAQGFWFLYPATEVLTLAIFLIWMKLRRNKPAAFDENRICLISIDSDMTMLGKMTETIETFCDKWDVSPKKAYFTTMAAEEICAAVIHNGFEGRRDGCLQVTVLALENGDLEMYIRNNSPRFDPFSMKNMRRVNEEDADMDAMGMLVIRRKAKSFAYRHYQNFNVMVLQI